MNYCTRTGAFIIPSIFANEGYTYCTLCTTSFFDYFAPEMIRRFLVRTDVVGSTEINRFEI